MGNRGIQRAISSDGTEIVGHVQGSGPPLVLVHGGLEDGELCWVDLLPHLQDTFTCYAMSRRARGLSGGSDDLSPWRLADDVASFAESIGEPVTLFGESDGAPLALGAASRSDAVSAVVVYEPPVFQMAGDDVVAKLETTIAGVAKDAAEGRLGAATRSFCRLLANQEEMVTLSASNYFEECEKYIPNLLRELELEAQAPDPGPADERTLANVTVPVLALVGARTALHHFFTRSGRHVEQSVPHGDFREVADAGHFGVLLAPRAIAGEIIRFAPQRSQADIA